MLSKVLSEDAANVQPVAWRRGPAVATAAAQPVPANAPDDIQHLRARVTELHAAAEQQARQAYEAGVRSGETAARKALEAEVRAVVDRLAATVADVSGARAEVIQRAEADTVRLAIEIARRVLHRELTVDANALLALTRAALQKLQSQEIHRVRVHPDQEAVVRASLQESGRGHGIEIIADPAQPPGGILFDIGRGALDASVGTQLDEIVRGLTDRLGNRS
ncbi:MAG TPA: FliH/SctL family protein [Bryobacteraceae bacterium]|nr:FliH/SctL family protein [Bryobacteraceae bacterium]